MSATTPIRDDIHSFTRTRFDRLEDAIRDGDTVTARELARAVRVEYVLAHDGFRDAIAAALSWAMDVTSPDEGEALGRRVVESSMQGGDLPQYTQGSLSIHLRLHEIRHTEQGWDFVIGADAILQPDEYPGYPQSLDEFCRALNRGIRARHWIESGTFESHGDTIIHHLPTGTR